MSLSPSYAPNRWSAPPVRRRIATYFVGGTPEIPRLVGELTRHGCIVHDLSVDVRDGVAESSMVCAVLVAGDEIDALVERLRGLTSVVSSELV